MVNRSIYNSRTTMAFICTCRVTVSLCYEALLSIWWKWHFSPCSREWMKSNLFWNIWFVADMCYMYFYFWSIVSSHQSLRKNDWNYIYFWNISVFFYNFFPGSKNWISRDRNCSRRLRVMTCLDAGLWSELQLYSVFCCLPGVSLSVNCLLVSFFISQRIKMQALGHVENWKMSGIFLVNFP